MRISLCSNVWSLNIHREKHSKFKNGIKYRDELTSFSANRFDYFFFFWSDRIDRSFLFLPSKKKILYKFQLHQWKFLLSYFDYKSCRVTRHLCIRYIFLVKFYLKMNVCLFDNQIGWLVHFPLLTEFGDIGFNQFLDSFRINFARSIVTNL